MRIGVFCSGGDAPGMNACLRAVVRSAVSQGHEVVGILRGYQGLLDEQFYVGEDGRAVMSLRSVSDIVQRGGTILRSSRSDEFRTPAGQKKAAAILRKHQIEGLVAIGGDGTFRGAIELAKHWDGRTIGTPGTIDNDLSGTDFTIGFHTAVQTAVEAIDKLRDTAESHERLFVVEVMGRHNGYIALYSALCGGAEVACIPETATNFDGILNHLEILRGRGKKSIIIVVAEGDEAGGAQKIQSQLEQQPLPYPARSVVLGHLQRGGSPCPADRLLGSRLGDMAVQAVLSGETGKMAGEIGGQVVLTPFAETVDIKHRPPEDLVRLLGVLAN